MSRFIHLSGQNVDIRTDQIAEIIDPPVRDPGDGLDPEDYREAGQEQQIVMVSGNEYCVTPDELAQIREALLQSDSQ